MSRFYAEIQGARGPATRQGNAKSGMQAHVCGWNVGVEVDCRAVGDNDVIEVRVTGGSNGGRSDIRHLATLHYNPVTGVVKELNAAGAEV